MREYLNTLTNNTQIWTLLSVLLGGMVTYVSTSKSDKRKIKQQLRKENMDQVLIPCCTSIEDTIELMENMKNQICFDNEDKFQKWMKDLNEPLIYIKASKRFFLPENARKLLERYSDQLKSFEDTLIDESKTCFNNYISFVKKELIAHYYDFIEIEVNETLLARFRLAILNKKYQFSLIEELTQFTIEIDCGEDEWVDIIDDFRKNWLENTGLDDLNIEYGIEEECVRKLFYFIDNNDLDDRSMEVMQKIQTHSADLFKNLIATLTEVKKGLFKEIDKIAK